MKIESQDLKAPLLEQLEKMRSHAKLAGPNKTTQAAFDVGIRTLETILVIIGNAEKEGAIDMEKLNIGLGKAISIDELMAGREAGGVMQQAILDLAERVEPGMAQPIDVKVIKPATFVNTVYTLRTKGKLPPEVKPVQDKKTGKYFLMRLKPGE